MSDVTLHITVMRPNFAVIPQPGTGLLQVVVRAERPLQASVQAVPRPS